MTSLLDELIQRAQKNPSKKIVVDLDTLRLLAGGGWSGGTDTGVPEVTTLPPAVSLDTINETLQAIANLTNE